uniref:Uncharacterized protein n=1 Tax=Parascaris univalens TaxID=6257 RepID=A0A915A391_PARUN
MQKPGKSVSKGNNADANNENKIDSSDEGSSEESSESSEERLKDSHQQQNEDLQEAAANKDNKKCKEVRPTISYTTQTIDEHSSYYSREVAEMYNVVRVVLLQTLCILSGYQQNEKWPLMKSSCLCGAFLLKFRNRPVGSATAMF